MAEGFSKDVDTAKGFSKDVDMSARMSFCMVMLRQDSLLSANFDL